MDYAFKTKINEFLFYDDFPNLLVRIKKGYQMKLKFLKIFLTGLIFSLSNVANAGLITLTDSQVQTTGGQNFNFLFNNLSGSDGTGGTFVIHAQGDYDGLVTETLAWNIENVISVSALGGFVNGVGVGGPFDFVNVFQPLGNIEFQKTYSINNLQLQSILNDGSLNIFVDLASTVGLFNPPNFVEVTFSYNSVPEPSTLAIFALGMIGLASRRFKKQ